jgi:hypothetical protein
MSKPHDSVHSEEFTQRDAERTASPPETSKASGEGQQTSLECEPIVTEGMGGAGGGDIDDLGDQGWPRPVERGRGSRQTTSGMGGAGGGDLDDLGSLTEPGET